MKARRNLSLSRWRWGWRVADDVAHRRAGGRRRRNAEQTAARIARRERVLALMYDPKKPLGFIARGWQTRVARDLGVDRATICRDVDALLREMFEPVQFGGLRFVVTCRFLRALLPTPAERRIYARLGLPTGPA